MRHLKVYEKFEYSQKIKDKITQYNWEEGQVKYTVAVSRSKNPLSEEYEYTTNRIELAVQALEHQNRFWDEQTYCIFETKTRVLSQEEIDLILNTKKYNL